MTLPDDTTELPLDELAPTEEEERRAGIIMRQQGRRSWLVPLLVAPISRILTAPDVPPSLFPEPGETLDEARVLAAHASGVVQRLVTDPSTELTDTDAAWLINLVVGCRWALTDAFAFLHVVGELAGIDSALSGRGLVQAVAGRAGAADPARLAPLAAVLLDNAVGLGVRRDFVPTPDDYFVPVARAFDRRCFGACRMRTWEDALRHAEAVWTPEAWSGLLTAMSLGGVRHAIQQASEFYLPGVEEVTRPDEPVEPRERLTRRDHERREVLEKERDEARRQAEAARQDAAAARKRQAQLIAARDKAQARLDDVTREVDRLRSEKDRAEKEAQAHRITVHRLMGRDEPEPPAPPQPPPAPPGDLLRGRTVFLFTGQARGAAREAQAAAIRTLGPDDVRLYEMEGGRPGPEVFPPGAIVVVDTRFVQHRHTDELQIRIRRSEVTYVTLKAGEGGLARRLAMELGWTPEPG